MSLRSRLVLVYAVAAAVLVAAGGMVFAHQLHAGLLKSSDAGLQGEARQLAEAVHESGSSVDLSDVNGGRKEPTATVTEVFAPNGRLTRSPAGFNRPLLPAAGMNAAQQSPSRFTRTIAGTAMRVYAIPVHRHDGTWVAVVATSLEPTEAALDQVEAELLIAGVAVVVLGGAGAWLLAGAALRPVERMRREAAHITANASKTGVYVPHTRDELAALGTTFNDVLARLQTALAGQRRLVADAGHELRTPLAILRTELELAAKPGRDRDELAAAITEAKSEVERLIRLAESLLLLARDDEGDRALTLRNQPIRPLLDDAAHAVQNQATERGVRMRVSSPDGEQAPRADVDAARLRQALDNLLDNALRAAPKGSTITVEARAAPAGVAIEVLDEGPGFPEEFLPQAFERFRRADRARARDAGGAGLGLAIVAAVARAHGGHAEAGNRAGGGAHVTMTLPYQPTAPEGAPRQSQAGPERSCLDASSGG